MWILDYIVTIIEVTDIVVYFCLLRPLTNLFSTTESNIVFKYEFSAIEIEARNTLARNMFPDDFHFGISTTYSKEATEEPMKYLSRDTNHYVRYNKNANRGLYERYEEDVKLARKLEATMFKISLSWSQILPNGLAGPVNEDALDHYNDVIDEMLANDLTPMVTLFYIDTPFILQQLGGWANSRIVEWFKAYARVVFRTLGDKVKYWITIEDPVGLCTHNYGDVLVPSTNLSGVIDYICGHHVLLAHAKVYHLYEQEFRPTQRGKVGIALNYTWFEPDDPNSKTDISGVKTAFQWYNGWLMNPLFAKKGDYSRTMRDLIGFKSHIQEFSDSRLPRFTDAEIREVKGAADFLGVHFSTVKRIHGLKISLYDEVSFDQDAAVRILPTNDGSDERSAKNTPRALGKLLRRLNNDYILPEIHLTGNGYASGKIEDIGRIVYHQQHISEVLKAMQSGIDIRSYLAWNLLENFQETNSSATSFCLASVDNIDAETSRESQLFSVISDIYKTKTIRSITDVSEICVSP